MATIREMAFKIKRLEKRNDPKQLDELIRLCFDTMELYRYIGQKFCSKKDTEHCCNAARVLSTKSQKGLGGKANAFVVKHGEFLPAQVKQLLMTHMGQMSAA